MTGTLIQPTAIKDILTGILLCMLIIAIMYIMPLIGIFAWMLLPLPVLFYRLKAGRNSSGIIMAVSLAVLIVFTNNLAFNTLYFGSLLMTGFFLGEFIEKHLSIERIMMYTGFAVLGTCLAVLLIYSLTQAQGIEQLISNYVSRYKVLSTQLFSESAQLYPEMKINQQMLEKASSLFVVIFPGIFINSYLTMVWLNILLIKKLLLKRGIIIKSIENLNQWKAPDYLVFGVIALSVLIFLPLNVLKVLSVNCLIILMFVYFFQGIAVVSFFFQKKNIPVALKLFFYILIAIQPVFLFLVIGFGLFDTWINFRKLDTAT
ncbi:MAG: YybS family protein [Desulfobacterales bacterium]|nr:YybS family protein [Desulfobacterales bacterium]